MRYQREIAELYAAIERHPGVFGLRGFPGKIFRVGRRESFISEGVPVLYTQVFHKGTWLDFAKGTEQELIAQKTTCATMPHTHAIGDACLYNRISTDNTCSDGYPMGLPHETKADLYNKEGKE